jgi:dTDP-4-amino-4,6-dideoxygalactose transaminase
MPSTIPLSDLRREHTRIRAEIEKAIERVVRRGWFTLGEEGEAFEAEWAEYCGVDHAVGVGNGTDALCLALRAANIGPGDEVILPALASGFTALAVSMTGATPVFVDVDERCLTLDPLALEDVITKRTAAIVPVHLYGCPADMEAILALARRHDLFVLEEAAHAHGACYQDKRAGGLGDAAAFSFYPTQNLGAYGDAGAVVTNDPNLAAKVRTLRHGGQKSPHEHELPGANSRLDEIQAAILRAKLPYLDGWTRQRQRLAARYDDGLCCDEALILPAVPESAEHAYHLYVVRTPLRDRLRDYLSGTGVRTGIHYPRGVHRQQAFSELGYETGSCPRAEAAADQVLSLPIFPQLSSREVAKVVRLIRFFFAMR